MHRLLSPCLPAALGLLLLAAPLGAAPAISHPKPGSPPRRAILDALRVPVSKFNKKRVTFTRVQINATNSYAWVGASTVDAKGRRVGPEFTSDLQAFLRKSGNGWRVLEWAYAGDVVTITWEEKYPQAPRKLWPHNR